MAIISSYPYDILIHDKDAWIGTDSFNRQTKQYTAEAIANYLNINGKISIAGQMGYKFVSIPLNETGTFAFAAGGGDGTAFSAITSLKISVKEISGQNVVPFIEYLVDDQILISSQKQISEFGHYEIKSYTVDPVNDQFYTLELEFIGGNGNLIVDNYYDIVNFTLAGEADKTFVFEQGVPSTTWTIQHNLEKYPSVSMVIGPNNTTQVFGQVDYVDLNNLTITIESATTGFAYLN